MAAQAARYPLPPSPLSCPSTRSAAAGFALPSPAEERISPLPPSPPSAAPTAFLLRGAPISFPSRRFGSRPFGRSKMAAATLSPPYPGVIADCSSNPTPVGVPNGLCPPQILSVGGRPQAAADLRLYPGKSYLEAAGGRSAGETVRAALADPVLRPRKHSVIQGIPVIAFDEEGEAILSIPLRFALVGKLTHSRPSMDLIRRAFSEFKFAGPVTAGLIDARHVLIRPSLEEDFMRVRSKSLWFVAKAPLRVTKWTPDFSPKHESPIAPVWVSFPDLPSHFFAKASVFLIASCLGVPLQLDKATETLVRPSRARVLVEIDVSVPLVDHICIALPKGRDYRQSVEYEQYPAYCSYCLHLGHSSVNCKTRQLKEAALVISKGKGLVSDTNEESILKSQNYGSAYRSRKEGASSSGESNMLAANAGRALSVAQRDALVPSDLEEGGTSVGGEGPVVYGASAEVGGMTGHPPDPLPTSSRMSFSPGATSDHLGLSVLEVGEFVPSPSGAQRVSPVGRISWADETDIVAEEEIRSAVSISEGSTAAVVDVSKKGSDSRDIGMGKAQVGKDTTGWNLQTEMEQKSGEVFTQASGDLTSGKAGDGKEEVSVKGGEQPDGELAPSTTKGASTVGASDKFATASSTPLEHQGLGDLVEVPVPVGSLIDAEVLVDTGLGAQGAQDVVGKDVGTPTSGGHSSSGKAGKFRRTKNKYRVSSQQLMNLQSSSSTRAKALSKFAIG